MTTKEKLKRRIDLMPNDLLDKVNEYINKLTETDRKSTKNKTLKLKGVFDDMNVREKAYD